MEANIALSALPLSGDFPFTVTTKRGPVFERDGVQLILCKRKEADARKYLWLNSGAKTPCYLSGLLPYPDGSFHAEVARKHYRVTVSPEKLTFLALGEG
jgi:hypothetical protein